MAIAGTTSEGAATGPASGTGNPGYSTAGYRAYILGSLLLVYVFNFIDRAILAILNDPIKESLRLEDWHMGLLGGLAFAMLYTTLGIPIARVAERVNRKWIIIFSLVLWSAMTVLCGLATSFVMLFVLRICVGIGEAGCTPPAQSMIADYFKPSSRATAVSIYALGVPLGAMIAGVAGGWINDYVTGQGVYAMFGSWGWSWAQGLVDWQSLEGWRLAFILVGFPGVVLAGILLLTMKEPPRGYTDPPQAVKPEPASFSQVMKILWNKPTYVHVVIGASLAAFAGYGIGHFVPAYFVRTHELSLSQAAIYYSLILGLCGAIGVFSSGYISDRISSRHPNALSWLPAIGMATAVPLYVFGFLQDVLWLTMPPLMVAALLKYFYLGPMYAVAGGVVDSRMRATSVAVMLFATNLIGLALGPTVSGLLSSVIKGGILSASDLELSLEACKVPANLSAEAVAVCSKADSTGLQYAIVIFACVYAWAALHYLLAGRTLQRDMVAKSA